METIYIDSLFLINFIIDYLLLLCSAKVASARVFRVWIALGALFGALYACLCILPGWEPVSHPVIKFCAGAAMCLIAFHKETQLLRCTLIFLLTSAGFGGILWALCLFGSVPFSGRQLYLPMNRKVLFLSFAGSYAVISLLFRRFDRVARQELQAVTISFQGRSVSCTVLKDTGNTLYDPVSNCGVMVLESKTILPLFGDCGTLLRADDPSGSFRALSELPEFSGRLRLIPFSSVGGSGLLLAFRPDSITIDGIPSENTLAAVTNARLSPANMYQGIF